MKCIIKCQSKFTQIPYLGALFILWNCFHIHNHIYLFLLKWTQSTSFSHVSHEMRTYNLIQLFQQWVISAMKYSVKFHLNSLGTNSFSEGKFIRIWNFLFSLCKMCLQNENVSNYIVKKNITMSRIVINSQEHSYLPFIVCTLKILCFS